jgi:hypothetical protein
LLLWEHGLLVDNSGHYARLLAHEVFQGLQEQLGINPSNIFAKTNQIFNLTLKSGVKILTFFEIKPLKYFFIARSWECMKNILVASAFGPLLLLGVLILVLENFHAQIFSEFVQD